PVTFMSPSAILASSTLSMLLQCTRRKSCRRKEAHTRWRSIAREAKSTRFCRGRIAPRSSSMRLDGGIGPPRFQHAHTPNPKEEILMKWITREHVKVDRVACPWLIKKFVDKDAEFIFAPPEKVMDEAKRHEAIPYDVKNVELGHHGKECSFEAILKKYKLTEDRALVLLGKIVNGADTDNTLYQQPEGPGLEAIAEGFRHLGYKDDHALNAAEWIVYDALYAYCQKMVRDGKPNGDFA